MSVATAPFDYRINIIIFYKLIQNVSFKNSQTAI